MALLYTVGQSLTAAAEVVLVTRVLIAPLDAVLALAAWAYLRKRSVSEAGSSSP
jgi:hypothetical protein